MNRDGVMRVLERFEPNNSLNYIKTLLKYEHLLLPGDYKNTLLKKNNVVVSVLGSHELSDIESTNQFIEDNKTGYLAKENGVLKEIYQLNLETVWEHLALSDSEFKKLFTAGVEINLDNLAFIPFSLKKDKEFWRLLQENHYDFLMKNASYEVQNDDEVRQWVRNSHHQGYNSELKPGMSKEDYLKFCLVNNNYDVKERRFFLVPREYKEDIDFVKEYIKGRPASQYVWNMLSPELQTNKEILELEFGTNKSFSISFMPYELRRSANYDFKENDDLFFKIVEMACKNNVIQDKEKVINNLCYNKTFLKYFRDIAVNDDLDVVKLSANEIIEMIMNKKLEADMKSDITLSSNSKSLKLKF